MGDAAGQVQCAPPDAPGGPAPAVEAGGGAPTPEQLRAIAQARHRGRKVGRAATVAAISGWTMAVFAFITLVTGLFSLPSFLLGVGLAVVAYVEVRGSRGLRRLDERAPRQLGFNQIALGVLIVTYCAWSAFQAVAGPGPYDSYLAMGGDTAAMMEPIDHLHRAISLAFYTLLLCGSVVAQGCGSLYYFTRRRHVVEFLRTTPEWVVEAMGDVH